MNTSRKSNMHDDTTSTSLYFSFDSTMSSISAYKTLGNTSDLDLLADKENIHDISMNSEHLNSTLEAKDMNKTTPIKTVKRVSQNVPVPTPLRAFGKNIINEFNAVCSTPSKEQLMRSVDLQRGSDAERCMDLGFAFKGVEDDKENDLTEDSKHVERETNVERSSPSKEETKQDKVEEDSKEKSLKINENAVSEELSQMSTSTCSTAEQKMAMMSTTDDDSVIEAKPQTNIKNIDTILEDVELTPTNVDPEKEEKPTTSKIGPSLKVKGYMGQLRRKSVRKSISEPSLEFNRPSRIGMTKSTSKTSVTTDPNKEISKLMNKILNKADVVVATKPVENIEEKKPAIVVSKKRQSILVTTQPEKRSYTFTQRMSVVVKTTLNSPARKLSRPSIANANQRRSVRPSIIPKSGAASSMSSNRNSVIPSQKNIERRSVMPSMNNPSSSANGALPKQTAARKSFFPRQSMMSSNVAKPGVIAKTLSEPATMKPVASAKPEIFYTCKTCDMKFRVKSLLDAHKRSHEDPKKTTSTTSNALNSSLTSLGPSTNRCKYCDKKFALVRALHIHLLQNCTKIPPGDKRKLQFTELNHVEKALLPAFNFAQPSTLPVNKNSQKTSFKQCDDIKSSAESLAEKKDKPTDSSVTPVVAKKPTQPVSAQKDFKKKIAHSGVYRTPSKTVPCHICKQSFKSIIEFTDHAMKVHAKKDFSDASTNIPESENTIN